MRRQAVSLFTTLTKEEIEAIITTVNETIAITHRSAIKEKNFSAADLWNIQRQKRSFVQRRSSF